MAACVFRAVLHLWNSDQEPREWVGARLSEFESREGYDKLAAALRSTLELT